MKNFDKLYNTIMLEKVKVTEKDKERVNKQTLEQGAEIEKEHTDSKEKAEEIAIQHVKEFPSVDTPTKLDSKYYKELKKMEKNLSKAIKSIKGKKKKGKK